MNELSFTPENVPLLTYKGEHEILCVDATGKKTANDTEAYSIDARTVRGEPAHTVPMWFYNGRLSTFAGRNEANIRSFNRGQLQDICNLLNKSVGREG